MFFLIILFLLLTLPACAPAAPPWDHGDLRYLDPADAPDPSLDLVAVYTRPLGTRQQVRLDFLDLAETANADITLTFNSQTGQQILRIPASGKPQWDSPTLPLPAIERNAGQDTLILTFNDLPPGYSVQVSVAGEDSTPVIASNAAPPAPAPILFAFSNTFPAATPAQTLRRWDGAHTGPYGERHGLKNLLTFAEANNIPLALLDLKTPASLSALDLAGGASLVRRMANTGLLILPDVHFGDGELDSLPHSLDAAKAFGLPVGDFLFGTNAPEPAYRYQFIQLAENASPAPFRQADGQIFIPLPMPKMEETTPAGLTLETRQLLLATALSPEADVVILGGDLPNSTWGDWDASQAGMAYIANHPWMRALDAVALERFAIPVEAYQPPAEPASQNELRNTLLAGLENAPENDLSDSALEMLAMLTTPTDDAGYDQLREQYLGEVNVLILASHWAENPAIQQTCSVDVNLDLKPDCVLSNENFLAIFQNNGAHLSYLFTRNKGKVHQIIGPTYQFIVGLSDSSLWQPELGLAADPRHIPGAFVETGAPWLAYTPTITGNSISFVSADDTKTKTYQFNEDRLVFNYTGDPITTQIALTLDPWQRFSPGWGKTYSGNGTDTWQLAGGPMVTIQAGGSEIWQFNDSAADLFGPEDPNQKFPPGHYIPLPMAITNAPLADGGTVTIIWVPQKSP